MAKKCFLCGLGGYLIDFIDETFQHCVMKLAFRKKKNFKYNEVELTKEASFDFVGYHSRCYNNVTALGSKYREEYKIFSGIRDYRAHPKSPRERNQICLQSQQPSRSIKEDSRTAVASEGIIESEIVIKSDDYNSEVDESSFGGNLFDAKDTENQTSRTSNRHQINENTITNESSDNESEIDDSNQFVDPLNTNASHQPAKRSRFNYTKTNLTKFRHTNETPRPLHSFTDEFRIYGDYVASQLLQLSTEESLLARDRIQSIITQSRLKDLKRKSQFNQGS